MKKLLLIDCMSSVYRAFYAIRGLKTSRGQPTNAVFGFIKMLDKMIKDYEPDYVAIATDTKEDTFRKQQFPAYKAHRKPTPAELISQLPLIKEVAAAYRIPWLESPGYEADDILATLADQADREGIATFILTGDKDLLQLVRENVQVISPHKEGILFTPRTVYDRYGVPPESLGDILALMGDVVDNIPGVPGVGEKTAVKLIQSYHNLENVLAHAGEVKNRRVRENLFKYADQARLSRNLVELKRDLPLKLKWSEARCREPDREKLRELYQKLEFKGLLREILPEAVLLPAKKIETPADLEEIISGREDLSFWVLPDVPDFMIARPRFLTIAAKEGESFYLPLEEEKETQAFFSLLRSFMEDEVLKKQVHDYKFLLHVFNNLGIELKGVDWDSRLASYLLDPSRPNHGLADLSWDFLGRSLPPLGPGKEELLETSPPSPAALGARAAAVRDLKDQLAPELKNKQLNRLLFEMELPLSRVLARMERNGITLDREILSRISREVEGELEKLTRRMHELAGEEFNLNSPTQLRRVLFEKLGLPAGKKTKTGYSTDVGVLRKLAPLHKLPALILDFRRLYKLKSTYLETLSSLINPETGRIHTTFHQTRTSTGRLSSSNPNLQNIPIRTDLGRRIRSAFIPRPPGWLFLSADYSQIELRVLAHLSGDPLLRAAFQRDEDIHAFTASHIFEVPLSEVTREMRRRAKTVNFGVIYGMGAYALSEDLEISMKEAQEFISKYFERYHEVAAYQKRVIEEARRDGYVTTMFHRRRYLPELKSDQHQIRRFGERTAVNTPIQGTSSDIIKLAMLDISRRLEKDFQARMLLQIHDELLFEVPPGELTSLQEMVRSCMEKVVKLSVRLKVDLKTGANWGEL